MKPYLVDRNIWPFLLMALYPLMPENIGSMILILAVLIIGLDVVLEKRKLNWSWKQALYTLPFWLFLVYEIVVGPFDVTISLRFLPFLVIPLLFFCRKPIYPQRLKRYFILSFQVSVLILGIYYCTLFLWSNSFSQFTDVNSYNIPFFRDFVGRQAQIQIHPTYYSSFLLVSFTQSLVVLITVKHRSVPKLTLNLGNTIFTSLLLLLFSSRIVELAWLLTLFACGLKVIISNKKKAIWVVMTILILLGSLSVIFKGALISRFKEIQTEYNKPVKGDYHNSTNIRVAIMQCSFLLIQDLPINGYGNDVQKKLNNCFEDQYDSDFYKVRDYNSHNFYVYLMLFGGWGFFFLFSFYLGIVFIGIKHSFVAILVFVQLLIINLTENYFFRHYGIVTFNYFMMVYLFLGPILSSEFRNKNGIYLD